jgi:methionine synthase II (cobalamin-independent)
MRLSSERILTTHVGSLPRSTAVDAVVARQVRAGIDIVSDGEMAKISYATYIKDRLSGFGGDQPRQVALDLQPYPEFRARMAVFAAAGIVLQIDCPDLAMARHTGFQHLTEAQFLQRAQFHVEALNEALRNIPASQLRMHVCWGNCEGPHDHDIDLAKVLAALAEGARRASQRLWP